MDDEEKKTKRRKRLKGEEGGRLHQDIKSVQQTLHASIRMHACMREMVPFMKSQEEESILIPRPSLLSLLESSVFAFLFSIAHSLVMWLSLSSLFLSVDVIRSCFLQTNELFPLPLVWGVCTPGSRRPVWSSYCSSSFRMDFFFCSLS